MIFCDIDFCISGTRQETLSREKKRHKVVIILVAAQLKGNSS
jgi:hypothetical protein